MSWKRIPMVGVTLALVFVMLATVWSTVAKVDTRFDWPNGAGGKPKRTLTYCVKGGDAAFGNDVNAAATAWNNANLGWTLTQVTDCSTADVVVEPADLGGMTADNHITLGSCMVNGSKGDWQGTAQPPASIKISNNAAANWGTPPTGRNRVRTIMHEFGHAMRLDHTFGAGDVMKQSTSTVAGTAFSAEDRKEAQTAAQYTIGGLKVVAHVAPSSGSAMVTLRPLPGAAAGINLTTATFITITPFFPVMQFSEVMWTPDFIAAQVHDFTAELGHHEGVTVTIVHTDPTQPVYFHAQLIFTDDPLTPGALPHARFVMTPTGIAVADTLIRLDGRGSFHDQLEETRLVYVWEIDEVGGDHFWQTQDEYAVAFLPVGEYEVTLTVEDVWGQEDRSAPQRVQVQSAPPYGTLCTEQGPPITELALRAMLDRYIPQYQSTLLVFTLCYAGDMVDSFDGRPRTGVLAANAAGRITSYGGYHDDAARALDSAPGHTSGDVHAAGFAGKAAAEAPFTAGDVISLAPVEPTGEIQSRHVLVYGGCRSNNPASTALDVADRDAVVANFAGDLNTTVTTVGMDGATGGWNFPGTLEGLRQALEQIGGQMNEHEQFILFVTDHGDLHPAVREVPPLYPGSNVLVTLDVPASLAGDMLHDPDNEIGPFHELGTGITLFTPGKPAPDAIFTLTLETTGNVYTAPVILPYDFTGDGVPNQPGEGYYIHFAVPEAALLPATSEMTVTQPILISYNQPIDSTVMMVNYISFDSGPIARRDEHRLYLPLALKE